MVYWVEKGKIVHFIRLHVQKFHIRYHVRKWKARARLFSRPILTCSKLHNLSQNKQTHHSLLTSAVHDTSFGDNCLLKVCVTLCQYRSTNNFKSYIIHSWLCWCFLCRLTRGESRVSLFYSIALARQLQSYSFASCMMFYWIFWGFTPQMRCWECRDKFSREKRM